MDHCVGEYGSAAGLAMRSPDPVIDLLFALRQAAAFGRQEFFERRRRRTQPAEFTAMEQRAARIEGWLRPAEAELLFTLAGQVSAGTAIVEVGSYLGKSTVFLAGGARIGGVQVHAVDPHTGDRTFVEFLGLKDIDTAPMFLANLESAGVREQVCALIATSASAAQSWKHGPIVSLLFIDGWHSTEAVIEDGAVWAPHLTSGAVVAFDDRNHPEVAAGIEELRRRGTLPDFAGDTGKIRVFAPPEMVDRSPRLRTLLRRREHWLHR